MGYLNIKQYTNQGTMQHNIQGQCKWKNETPIC